MTASSTNNEEVSESHLSDTSVSEYRFRDMGITDYSISDFRLMQDDVNFVRTFGPALPVQLQADLQIRKYKADKAIADSIVELQSSFRPMLQQAAEEALTRQEQEEQKQQGLLTVGELYDIVRGIQYQIKSLTDKKHRKAKKSQDK
ncbi:MAG: hypothetical protein ACJ72J_17160 [Nitrososphaeraceae archaeon]